MRRALEVIAALAVVGLQIGLWPQLTLRVEPAFALALAFAWGFNVSGLAGFRLAFALGVLLDLYAQHTFGMFTIAMSAGYGVALAFTRDEDDSLAAQLTVVLAGAATYELIVLAWLRLTDPQLPFLADLVGVSTLNSAGTVIAFLLFAAIIGAYLSRLRPYAHRSIRVQ